MTAVNFNVSPSVNVNEDGLMETDSTATYLPFLPCWLTAILAAPEPELKEITPSRSYSSFSETEKVTFHWKGKDEAWMDLTLTQSGIVLTFHFVPH